MLFTPWNAIDSLRAIVYIPDLKLAFAVMDYVQPVFFRLLNTQIYNATPKICRRYEMEYTGRQSQGWQSESQQKVCDALPVAN